MNEDANERTNNRKGKMALGATSSVSYRYRSRIDSGCRNGDQTADTAVQWGNNKNQRREGKVRW